MTALHRIRGSLRRRGLSGTLRLAVQNVIWKQHDLVNAWHPRRLRVRRREARFDRAYGTQTQRIIELDELDPARIQGDRLECAIHIESTPVLQVEEILDGLGIEFPEFEFVDFGMGLGRVLMIASRRPFARVTGVEFSGELCAMAEKNFEQFSSRVETPAEVRFCCADAGEFPIPDSKLVLYFYNPFKEPVMAEVLRNVERSLERNPREVFVVYVNPNYEELLEKSPCFRPVHRVEVDPDRRRFREAQSYVVYASQPAAAR